MICDIRKHEEIARDIFALTLSGGGFTAPGQFCQIAVPGFSLRRPISVCDYDDESFLLVYRAVGEGTKALSRIRKGTLDTLTGLGNGYTLCGEKPLLIGGGTGVPPLCGLYRRLCEAGKAPRVVLGFGSEKDAILLSAFDSPVVRTMDGSLGIKGTVLDGMKDLSYDYLYACGPEGMLKALPEGTPGQFSLEGRMACGFGACMGCSRQFKSGVKRVCREGPVFDREDILWT